MRTGETESMISGEESITLIERRLVTLGAMLGGLAVVLGAFGAHALRTRISAEELDWWQTGVHYQMWHALAVTGLGFSRFSWARLPAWLFVMGVTIFSGTLYAMALGAPRSLGTVTPFGGLAMICGWALLAWRASRSRSD